MYRIDAHTQTDNLYANVAETSHRNTSVYSALTTRLQRLNKTKDETIEQSLIGFASYSWNQTFWLISSEAHIIKIAHVFAETSISLRLG